MGTGLWTFFEGTFISLPMGEPKSRRRIGGPLWDDNSGPQQDWIQRWTIRSSKGRQSGFLCDGHGKQPKKGPNKDQPKRHIILSGKRKIVGVEDVSDNSEEFNRIEDLRPFSIDVDPTIQLSREVTPYLRRDHKDGVFVKKKSVTIPVVK